MRKLDQACGRLNGGPGWFAIEHPPTRPRESVEDGNDRLKTRLWTSFSGSRWSAFLYKA